MPPEQVRLPFDSAQDADPDAVGQLLEGHRRYLCLLGRTWIKPPLCSKVDASDLAQDALLKAHDHFHSFRGRSRGELAVWLRQILAQTLVNYARRYRSEGRELSRERSLQQMFDHSSAAFGSVDPICNSTPSQSVERRESELALAEALGQLSEDHRQVIALRNLEQLPWSEVARRMDRSTDATRMLWTRALQALRPRLEDR